MAKRGRRGGFGWTSKHHKTNGEMLSNSALNKVIEGRKEAEAGNCASALQHVAMAARILGRAFEDYHAAGADAFKQDVFVEADRRLKSLLGNISGHCLKSVEEEMAAAYAQSVRRFGR